MNSVVHFEIPSSDKNRAKKFYSDVFGWDIIDMPINGYEYSSAITSPIDEHYTPKEKGTINGAIIEKDESVSAPVITINVESIEEHAKKIEASGGKLIVPKDEVPDMGYYAYFKDTEGNVMGLWENLKK
ncbi:MAG: VOC family protein [Bacteroidetes bacterium]|nr:VOC family protein [Bacteroidota bacterium]